MVLMKQQNQMNDTPRDCMVNDSEFHSQTQLISSDRNKAKSQTGHSRSRKEQQSDARHKSGSVSKSRGASYPKNASTCPRTSIKGQSQVQGIQINNDML